MYKTKYSLLHHSRSYSHVYIGIGSTSMYKGHLNSTAFIKAPGSSVGRASGFNTQGFGFESNCEQDLFILYFVAFDALFAGRLVPYRSNQA